MSNDLAEILKSIRVTQANILSRLNTLEEEQAQAGTSELSVPGRWGYASPTTPPSKRLAIRAGYAWFSLLDYDDYNDCKYWPNFNPEPSISAFTDAYYYRWVIPYYPLTQWDPVIGFDVWEDSSEYETYEQCASAINDELYFDWRAPNTGGPIFAFCALAIRNDGTTGAINRFLPITLGDRSQSSFIVRDLRPWFKLTYWS